MYFDCSCNSTNSHGKVLFQLHVNNFFFNFAKTQLWSMYISKLLLYGSLQEQRVERMFLESYVVSSSPTRIKNVSPNRISAKVPVKSKYTVLSIVVDLIRYSVQSFCLFKKQNILLLTKIKHTGEKEHFMNFLYAGILYTGKLLIKHRKLRNTA